MKKPTKQEINEVLTRGVEEVIPASVLSKQLSSGVRLRIKLGIDPTSPNIHLGRSVLLWKLRAFQDMGHWVVFIIGDYTAQIGDTSDKDSERPVLSEAQVKKNMKDYLKQAYLILDKNKTEVQFNSKWLKKIGTAEIIKLTGLFSLNEFQSRELIKLRVNAGKRVSMREALYPIMQGYDSVAVRADVEIGGTDQKFNLLAGRTIQQAYKQNPQSILTMTILEGTDGRKMSSSWGNVINLTDSPSEMFAKTMRVPDSLIEKYFLLTTPLATTEIKKFLKLSPREAKLELAKQLVTQYHSAKLAVTAQENFIKQFSLGEVPADVATKKIKAGTYQLPDLLLLLGLVSSKSEARRLVSQNGIKIAGKPYNMATLMVSGEVIIQVGKRKIIKVVTK